MFNIKMEVNMDAQAVIEAVNYGCSGNAQGGRAVVGPTMEAWYGQIHEFGGTRHPPRPFMRPALNLSLRTMPQCFGNCIKSGGIPALLKAGVIVETNAKKHMKPGYGVPSTPGTPPHIQTANLRNSIRTEIVPQR